MEIIFREENGKLFGSTNIIGIGKKQPKLIYGEQAKKLREGANLTIEQLAAIFDVRENVIKKIENQQSALDEKMCNKYMDKFNVTKEYFFDLDLETLILTGEGHVIKSFDNGKDCLDKYNAIMDEYFEAHKSGKTFIKVDFSEN